MSSFFKFASVAYPDQYGYAFDSSAWSTRSIETSHYYRQFSTYGDGLVQHSSDHAVTFEFLADYLASLAVAMMANDELTRAVGYSLRHEPLADRIAFAASVVYKESDKDWSKRRFYSMELLKMGTPAKKHDRRYSEISQYNDGSRSSIYRLCLSEYSTMFEAFQVAEAIKNWANAQAKHISVGEGFPEFFNGDWAQNNALRSALICCRYIVEALERREWAQSSIDNYQRRVKPPVVSDVA